MREHDQLRLSQCDAADAIKRSPGGLEKWLGHTVKKSFAQVTMAQVTGESMWVKITGVEGNQLVGTLVNEPCLATYLQHGDRVILAEDEIFAVDVG